MVKSHRLPYNVWTRGAAADKLEFRLPHLLTWHNVARCLQSWSPAHIHSAATDYYAQAEKHVKHYELYSPADEQYDDHATSKGGGEMQLGCRVVHRLSLSDVPDAKERLGVACWGRGVGGKIQEVSNRQRVLPRTVGPPSPARRRTCCPGGSAQRGRLPGCAARPRLPGAAWPASPAR